RPADLAQDTYHPRRGLRAERLDQGLQVYAVEQLHHVIEDAVFGDAEVVQLHGVGRAQQRRRFGLLFESALNQGRVLAGFAAQHFRLDELDRGVASQHAVARSPHLPHAALTEHREQPVTPHFPFLADLLAKLGYYTRDYDGDTDQQEVGIVH